MGTIQLLLPGTILTRLHHTNSTRPLLPRMNLSDPLGGSSRANSLKPFELRHETYTRTYFFQNFVSLADPNADRSTSPHDRSLVLADLYIVTPPQPISRRFHGTIRSMTPPICNHRRQIETTDPPSRKTSRIQVLCRE